MILLIVCGVLAVVGAGAAFLLYNKATEIDRGSPTVAVRQFLRAVFVDKSEDRVRLFTCPEWTPSRTEQVRGSFDPEVKVSWETVTEESRQGNSGTVAAQMRLVFRGHVDLQPWHFDVVDRNGWRVCAAAPS